MQRIEIRSLLSLAAVALLLGSCAQQGPVVVQPDQPPQSNQPRQPEASAAVEPLPEVPRIDPMADVLGDKPLPVVQGAVERIDCMSGQENLHARMALEARGGQIQNFAYYSKWKPRTCSLDFTRNAPGTKWRLMPDGATRVHTPQGRFVIRTLADAFVFEFQNVERRKFCGMPGDINGTMTIKRSSGKPECSVAGIMDANDTFLEALYRAK